LRWEKDKGADRYIVMRSVYGEGGPGVFEVVYQGEDQEYVDNDIATAVMYGYRLDKTKGKKTYEGNEYKYYMRPKPGSGVITAQSINEGRSVYLSWEADASADKYVVMKVEAGNDGVDFEDRYKLERIELEGVNAYVDNAVAAEKSYAYRLDKICGKQIFVGTEVTFFWKTRADPFPGVIKAQNLNNGKAAYLTWEEDFGADQYRVMQAINDGNPIVFTMRVNGMDGYVEQGKTSALDGNLSDDRSYVYRLDKLRDGVWIVGLAITKFDQMRPLPAGVRPDVKSFRSDGYILISWPYDDGADQYRLMRSRDNPPTESYMTYTQVYAGIGTQFLDTTPILDGRYIYKLYKIRNGIEYHWDDMTALGVAVRTEQDDHEPNNNERQATVLEGSLNANIYCYCYTPPELVLEDTDWYQVNLQPGKMANITVTYKNPADSGLWRVDVPPFPEETIIHDVKFKVKNQDAYQRYVAFAVRPDRALFSMKGVGGIGGTIIGYTIKLESITDNE
jgi:hypothetical protein